jgi:hypothetical protein
MKLQHYDTRVPSLSPSRRLYTGCDVFFHLLLHCRRELRSYHSVTEMHRYIGLKVVYSPSFHWIAIYHDLIYCTAFRFHVKPAPPHTYHHHNNLNCVTVCKTNVYVFVTHMCMYTHVYVKHDIHNRHLFRRGKGYRIAKQFSNITTLFLNTLKCYVNYIPPDLKHKKTNPSLYKARTWYNWPYTNVCTSTTCMVPPDINWWNS